MFPATSPPQLPQSTRLNGFKSGFPLNYPGLTLFPLVDSLLFPVTSQLPRLRGFKPALFPICAVTTEKLLSSDFLALFSQKNDPFPNCTTVAVQKGL